ncbi:hypothetical protein [Parabacteroides provencensis]|uniref:hypothetical protein n=1 Tax=Parabacteroides provencensis TaxID=1944636 RepID=UPI000C144954|nr:hypothetical protein [Parabacteroides provencensis]
MTKKYVLAAICLVTMAGCNNNEFENETSLASGETPIELKTGVDTRAAISNGDVVTATIALIAKEAPEPTAAEWNALVPITTNTLGDGGTFANYETDAANVSSGTFTASATAQSVGFSVPLYYNKASNTRAYMVGVAPAGTLSSGNGKVTFPSVDGLQDVLYASTIDKGTVETAAANEKFFTFNHQTGQVRFYIQKEVGMSADSVVTVQGVTLLNVGLPESITLGDSVITYQDKGEFALPGINSSAAATEAGIDVGSPVMIRPMASMNINITISIKGVSKTYSNVPVTFEGTEGGTGITKGYSSLVTVTVKRKVNTTESQIDVKAVVAPWKTGNTGKVDLD